MEDCSQSIGAYLEDSFDVSSDRAAWTIVEWWTRLGSEITIAAVLDVECSVAFEPVLKMLSKLEWDQHF